MPTFRVTIPNLPQIQQALMSYPSISTPILQRAIVGAQAVLAKFTNASTVPIRTGYLVQNWESEIGNLQARWRPKAFYAPYVEFGTRPHTIVPVNKRVLANKATGEIFGKKVNHPGTAANPFMERIVASAQPEITALFETAMSQIGNAIIQSAS